MPAYIGEIKFIHRADCTQNCYNKSLSPHIRKHELTMRSEN